MSGIRKMRAAALLLGCLLLTGMFAGCGKKEETPANTVSVYYINKEETKITAVEKEPEGGDRCRVCFELRLKKAAEEAKRIGADYVTTTLTISPLKNAAVLNEVGERACKEIGVAWLPSDFKKKNGYKRSVELSEEYGMYRQNYCGCVFSKREREENL